MYHFATLFDFNYLSRGLTLIESLDKTLGNNYHLYILALDDLTALHFEKKINQKTTVLMVKELEQKFPELISAKANRSTIEFYFTLSPILPLYILNTFSGCDRITTLDADIYFLSSPEVIFNSYSTNDILITPHDFSEDMRFLETHGKYNVSFQSFPKTENAIRLLNDWKDKCVEWCGDFLNPKDGNFADQKYLDNWQENFANVVPIDLKISGRAPWNLNKTNLKLGSKFTVDGEPLVFYHFHHLRIYGKFIAHGLDLYGVNEISRPIKRLYRQYILQLKKFSRTDKFNDGEILRYQHALQDKNILDTVWEKELGCLLIFNTVYFFNIRLLKRGINYFSRKINGLFN